MLARFDKGADGACRYYNTSDGHCTDEVWLTSHLGYPSFKQRILRPNRAYNADVFVHTWNAASEAEIRRVYQPRAASFGAAGTLTR